MKLTEDNVRKIALEIVLDLEPFAARDDQEARDLLMYSTGIVQMAQAVIDGMREEKNG